IGSEAYQIDYGRNRLVFVIVDFVDYKDHRFLRFTQHERKLFVYRGQTFFGIDDEKQKIAVAKRFLGGAANLRGQFRFTRAKNAAGVPKNKRPCATCANRGNSVARNSRLIVNDGNFSPDETIE